MQKPVLIVGQVTNSKIYKIKIPKTLNEKVLGIKIYLFNHGFMIVLCR